MLYSQQGNDSNRAVISLWYQITIQTLSSRYWRHIADCKCPLVAGMSSTQLLISSLQRSGKLLYHGICWCVPITRSMIERLSWTLVLYFTCSALILRFLYHFHYGSATHLEPQVQRSNNHIPYCPLCCTCGKDNIGHKRLVTSDARSGITHTLLLCIFRGLT